MHIGDKFSDVCREKRHRDSARTHPIMSEDDKDERFYRDTEAIAYPKLDDWQLALLEPLGHRRMLRRGELVFKAGQRDLGLTVVLSGKVEAFAALDGIEHILGTLGPRGFVGDVAMLNGTSAVGSVRGKAEESEILEIPAAELRRALMELPGVSEPIVNAFIVRRQRLLRDREFVGLRVVATEGSRDGHLIHDFLDKIVSRIGSFNLKARTGADFANA